jgi:hypothetical protein
MKSGFLVTRAMMLGRPAFASVKSPILTQRLLSPKS